MEAVTLAELCERHSKGLPCQEARTGSESFTRFSAFIEGVLPRWCKHRGELPATSRHVAQVLRDKQKHRKVGAGPSMPHRQGGTQDGAGHSAPRPPLCMGAAVPQRSHPARPQGSGVLCRIWAFTVSPKRFLPHRVMRLSSFLAGCCPSLFLLSCVYTWQDK